MPLSPGSPHTTALEAFAPPTGYRFEPELQGTPPRHVPKEFRESPYFARQRKAIVGLFVAGVLCLACGQLPLFKEWGLYVLPLAFLGWIGGGLLVLSAGAWLSAKLRRGPLPYIEEGVPIVARVRELVLRPTALINGQPSTYAFSAIIEYRDPESGVVVAKQVDSRSFSASAKDKYRTSYRVGDYVTAVYRKSNPGKTICLYGFLEFRPELGLVSVEPAQTPGLVQTALSVGAVFGLFVVLFWNVYAFSKYQPLELTFAQTAVPMAAGGLGLGGGLLAWLGRRQARAHRALATRNATAQAAGEAVELAPATRGPFGVQGLPRSLILICGALLLGGATALCWFYTANALLDMSPPQLRPVEIVEFWSTTHSFLFREYEIEYRLPGETKTRKVLSTPAQMRQFQSRHAVAELHAGRFGCAWVKSLAPAD